MKKKLDVIKKKIVIKAVKINAKQKNTLFHLHFKTSMDFNVFLLEKKIKKFLPKKWLHWLHQ